MSRSAPPISLDQLRAWIIADEGLQHRLAPIETREAFAHQASEVVRERGGDLPTAEVFAALQPDPLGVDRFDNAPPTDLDWPSVGWLPASVQETTHGSVVDWIHLAGARLTEPFFEDSLRRARGLPFNQLIRRRTPVAVLANTDDGQRRAPDGLVFHMSRCGSTLVARMLAAVEANVVVSEAPPLDSIVQLIRSDFGLGSFSQVQLLRGMISALGREPLGRDGRYVVKLDSWHALALPLFRAAFPDTPWIFLYRDPVEVLVSHKRRRGMQTVPGALGDIFGAPEGLEIYPDEYTAHVLAHICEAAIDHYALGGGIVVDYASLPEALEAVILPHFGIEPTPDERTAMANATRLDAKSPYFVFSDDRWQKQREATEALREIAGRHLVARIEQLEQLAQR